MFKDFDEGKVVYSGKAEVAELSEFVHTNSIPLVMDFSYDFAPIIFGGSIKNHVLLFASTKADNYAEIKDTLTKLAKSFKGKLMFVVVDTEIKELKQIVDFFKVPETEHPALRIVKLGENMQRFKSQDLVLDEENIKVFIEKYLAGELKPELLSEDIPEDWDHKPVKVLVGKNFNQVVNSTEKNTLVMFYAPWCGHCKKLEPLWEELSEKYKESVDVVIAKMDATKNELEVTETFEKCITGLVAPACQNVELTLPKQVCKEINYGYAEDTVEEPVYEAPEPAYAPAPAPAYAAAAPAEAEAKYYKY